MPRGFWWSKTENSPTPETLSNSERIQAYPLCAADST